MEEYNVPFFPINTQPTSNSPYVKLGRGGSPVSPVPVAPPPSNIVPVNLGIGAITLLPVPGGYVFPTFHGPLIGKPVNYPTIPGQSVPKDEPPTYQPPPPPASTIVFPDPVITDRGTLLDDLIALSPLNPALGVAIYSRAQLDVPAMDMEDLRYVRKLYQNPFPEMVGLDDSNVYLFITEVVDNLLAGLNPAAARAKALIDIKGNTYLYTPEGQPIKPGPPPLKFTQGTPNTSTPGTGEKKNNSWVFWLIAAILILKK